MSEPQYQQPSQALRQALAVQREFIEEEFRDLRRQLHPPEPHGMNGQATQKLWMIVGGVSVLAVIGMFLLNIWTDEGIELRRTVHMLEIGQGQLIGRVERLERDVNGLQAAIETSRAILEQVYIERFGAPPKKRTSR